MVGPLRPVGQHPSRHHGMYVWKVSLHVVARPATRKTTPPQHKITSSIIQHTKTTHSTMRRDSWLSFLERNAPRLDAVQVLGLLPERTTPLQLLAPYLTKVRGVVCGWGVVGRGA